GVAIRPQLEREVRLQSDEDRAEDVAAHNGTAQGADPAEHRGHEGEEQGIRPDIGCDLARLRDEQVGADPGEEAADPEGRGRDGVRPYPEDACHSEVLRRRAHLYAHTGPLEEETQTREEDDGDCDGDDVELRG